MPPVKLCASGCLLITSSVTCSKRGRKKLLMMFCRQVFNSDTNLKFSHFFVASKHSKSAQLLELLGSRDSFAVERWRTMAVQAMQQKLVSWEPNGMSSLILFVIGNYFNLSLGHIRFPWLCNCAFFLQIGLFGIQWKLSGKQHFCRIPLRNLIT